MRKLISLALVCALLLGWCAIPAAAEDAPPDAYHADMLHFYRHFMDQPGGWEVLSDDSIYGYNHAAEELNGNRTFQIMLDATHFLTESSWIDILGGTYDVDDIKVQYYVTALSSLLMTMEENLADTRAAQAKATASMTWTDYAAKTGSALAGVFAGAAGGDALFQSAFTLCGIGIDTVGDSIQTLEHYEVLTLNAETYLSYRTLLQTLKDRAADPLLAQAAGYLMDAVDRNFRYRMEHFQDFADIAASAQSDQFFNVLDRVIESLSPEELASGSWAALSILGRFAGHIGDFRLGVAIGELAMDVLIGGSDLIQRYYELAAMAAAREALISVIAEKNATVGTSAEVSQISAITELMTDLNYVNLRGAYCVYRINTTDGQLMRLMLGSRDSGAWFETIQWICTQMDGLISRIIPDRTPDADMSSIELETRAEDGYEYAVITARDAAGDEVWRYETPQCVMTELSAVAAIGLIEDCYYFVEDTSVVCLDAQTGAVLWKNDDYGSRATGIAFDEDAIYLCGYYGPDFYAISYNGETLARIEQFDPNYYWAQEIELQDGQAAVYLHGGGASYDEPVVFHVDLHTYAVTSGAGASAADSLSIEDLSQLLNDYFASYPWGNEDILSGKVTNGSWRNDTEALFELRLQTGSAEQTHQANLLAGLVSIDAGTLTGYIQWNGGDQEAIDLNAPQ